MKRNLLVSIIVFCAIFLLSCEKTDSTPKGSVTFGANNHIINCITKVVIVIDGEEVGVIPGFSDAITECGNKQNLTKGLPIGHHTYVAKIIPEHGNECRKEISGSFDLIQNECVKIFIDYQKINFNNAE